MIHGEMISADRGAYLAEFEPAEEGGYVVRFPAIPDMATEGRSLEEGWVMAADFLHGYLETLRGAWAPRPEKRANASFRAVSRRLPALSPAAR